MPNIENRPMTNTATSPAKIPANVRVMIALCASPTLMVLAFLFYNLVTAQWSEIGVSTIIFSVLGIFAYSIVILGRLPFRK